MTSISTDSRQPDSRDSSDPFASARGVADAVLYEGYMLYPYRASSTKNQVRWQFGVLTPGSFSEIDGSEEWSMHTECLVEVTGTGKAAVRLQLRWLQVQERTVEAAVGSPGGSGATFEPVGGLSVDGIDYLPWEEAVEQTVEVGPVLFGPMGNGGGEEVGFHLAGGREEEVLEDRQGIARGRLVRVRRPIEGQIRVVARRAGGTPTLVRLAVEVENLTGFDGPWLRREALRVSLVATHLMLAADGGRFLSLLDPPGHAEAAAAECRQRGGFPVLIGDDDVVLVSPIILYDHPAVAPESPGDLCDATEIDEILALRVLTLTEEEKAEARRTDPRAAAIIDRCETMPPEVWERLHGAVRAMADPEAPSGAGPVTGGPGCSTGMDAEAPWWDPAVDGATDPWTDTVVVGGTAVGKGSKVRLHPTHRSDAQDLFLEGMAATVAGVFTDVDGAVQVAVTVDEDPATAELAWQGRYLFFHPDEVDPQRTVGTRGGAP